MSTLELRENLTQANVNLSAVSTHHKMHTKSLTWGETTPAKVILTEPLHPPASILEIVQDSQSGSVPGEAR